MAHGHIAGPPGVAARYARSAPAIDLAVGLQLTHVRQDIHPFIRMNGWAECYARSARAIPGEPVGSAGRSRLSPGKGPLARKITPATRIEPHKGGYWARRGPERRSSAMSNGHRLALSYESWRTLYRRSRRVPGGCQRRWCRRRPRPGGGDHPLRAVPLATTLVSARTGGSLRAQAGIRPRSRDQPRPPMM